MKLLKSPICYGAPVVQWPENHVLSLIQVSRSRIKIQFCHFLAKCPEKIILLLWTCFFILLKQGKKRINNENHCWRDSPSSKAQSTPEDWEWEWMHLCMVFGESPPLQTHPLEYKVAGVCVFCSLLHNQCLEHLPHSRHSLCICWTNECVCTSEVFWLLKSVLFEVLHWLPDIRAWIRTPALRGH